MCHCHRILKGVRVFKPKRHLWTREDNKFLGTRPDAQIAKLLGLSPVAIQQRRYSLGIHHGTGHFTPGPKGTAVAARRRRRHGR